MKFKATLHTDGRGLWSNSVKTVKHTKMRLREHSDDFGELRVYFTKRYWNIQKSGLIYTDPKWIREFKLALRAVGFSQWAVRHVDYSEQGMQGRDYVSLDVSGPFIRAYLDRENR